MTENRFSAEQLREFVIAAHWNLPKVQEVLVPFPEILNVPYQWGENDWETAIQAAAHVGSAHVADFLLAKGAPLEICTAAMLGRQRDVEHLLADNSTLIDATGEHGIPLMAHVALSDNVLLAQLLFALGAHQGMSYALSNAITKGHVEMARWILENGKPDLTWKNDEGKTAFTIASEISHEPALTLLKSFGAG